MARIRSIKPEFPQSESMGRVSRDARLLFVMLWTICDDHGRARAHSRMLASLLFPYDDDAGDGIKGWLSELENEGCIRLYEVAGSQYLEVTGWKTHQRIDKPSKPQFPEPKGAAPESSRVSREHSCEEGKGREGKGEERKPPASSSATTPPEATLVPAEPPLLTFLLNDGSEFPISRDQANEFADLYPAIDVPQQLRAIKAWCMSNPKNRKTRSGAMKFVNGWLSRAQNNARPEAGTSRTSAAPALPRLQA